MGQYIIKKYGLVVFLFGATVIVNLGNYFLFLIVGRILGPADFSTAHIISSIVLFLSFIALSLQMTTAKISSEVAVSKGEEKRDKFVQRIYNFTNVFSIVLSVCLIFTVPFVSKFLNFDSSLSLYILILGIPFYFKLCVKRGFYQSAEKFIKLIDTYFKEMLIRAICTISALYILILFKPEAIIESISIGFILSFILTSWLHRKFLAKSSMSFNLKGISKIGKIFFSIALFEFSRILIVNSSIFQVKHFFSDVDAGLYSSISLVGLVILFGSFTAITVLFPKVIELEKKGEPHKHLFWSSMFLVFAFGLSISFVCYAFDTTAVRILFGEAYLGVSNLLWQYALSITIFSCATVFVYYHVSLDNYLPVWISLIIGIVQIIFIQHRHESIQEVVTIQLCMMCLLLASLFIYHRIKTYSQIKMKIEDIANPLQKVLIDS